MSVSRVEYDAALKRVQRRATHRPCSVVEPCGETASCRCVVYTLAALGLDEPPTEATRMSTEDALVYLVDRHHRTLTGSRKHDPENRDWTDCHCKTCELVRHVLPTARVLAEREQLAADRAALVAVVPPSESPKACPTCGSGWTYHHACPDRGSGIDGGAATRRAAR